MPVRNIYKEYLPESYYHVYNRGSNKAGIFLDESYYIVFLSLLKRYLGDETEKRSNHGVYLNYHDDVELLAFCLMHNHFHLFLYQKSSSALKEFMKSLSVSYGMYFNRRYKRAGPVFQQRYKAVRIVDDTQLLHISRYIHLNPDDYINHRWSSLPYYIGQRRASWIKPARVIELFEGTDYLNFLKEYASRRNELKQLKNELADA